jgi:hypothetical protein
MSKSTLPSPNDLLVTVKHKSVFVTQEIRFIPVNLIRSVKADWLIFCVGNLAFNHKAATFVVSKRYNHNGTVVAFVFVWRGDAIVI